MPAIGSSDLNMKRKRNWAKPLAFVEEGVEAPEEAVEEVEEEKEWEQEA